MTTTDRDVWQQIPVCTGDNPEWLRVTRDIGFACYISPSGKRGPGGKYRPGFDHRWTIWFSGTLLGEGFTDDHYAARSACMQEVDRVEFRVREAIRAMDVRKWRALCVKCGPDVWPSNVRDAVGFACADCGKPAVYSLPPETL